MKRRLLPLVLALCLLGVCTALGERWFPFARVRWGAAPSPELLDPGAEPRQLLRYDWASAPRPFSLLVQRGMGRVRGVLQVVEDYAPPTAFRLAPDESLVRFGVARVTWRIQDASIGDDARASESASRATEAAARALVGHRVVTFLGPSGQLVVETSPVPGMLETRLLDDLVRILELELSPPLPRAPVGVGARWAVTRSRPFALATRAEHRSVFVLRDLEPGAIDLDAEITVSAPAQAASGTDAPVVVDRVEGILRGRIVRMLGEPTPVLTDLSLEGAMSLTEVEPGQTEPTDGQRGRGYRVVVTSRESMKADAVSEVIP